jgi:signal transduction histidine kinase
MVDAVHGPPGASDSSHDSEASLMTDLARQRAITERLLLTALHERDVTRDAVEAGRRAAFLASASRDLGMSLDESATREAVRRRALPRDGSWCIVDIIEVDGAARRLRVVHPNPAKQALAQAFADGRFPIPACRIGQPRVVVSLDARMGASPVDLGELGVGSALVVPLVVRESMLGAITYVTREGDAPLSREDVALASDLADLCALALDNARLYHEAQRLREGAEAANRAKSSFLGTMSHELMTPLNAIGGYVTLLEMGLHGPVSADQQVDLARIRHNQLHLLTLITEILTFARSEGGQLEYRFTEVSVERALHDVTDMLQGTVDERHVTVVQPPADADAVVWADVDRLRQILLNLVMNAVKYATVAGGQITLSVTSTPQAVAIHVSDDGPGIPEDKLATIFEPFVQLASGLTDRHGGVGLGLSISRELARAMDGELTVESRLGVGSRFTLELPRVRHTSGKSP